MQQANENGWEGLLANFGLDGFGDITHNLGYVLAMLPDMLVGLLTGKTKSLNMDNCMIPLASIVAGMFVKNPILKMILIGMGGANLINKAGHEALERKANEGSVPDRYAASNRQVAYRQYADEPLNPRLSNPVLKGSCLIVHIDRVPCTIQLPQTVVDAYQAGALPLNTLANAILAKMSRCNLWPCSSMRMVVRSVRQSADQEEYNKNIIKAQYERQESGRKTAAERQVELLSTALGSAPSANGYWLNASGKTYPSFYPKGLTVSPFNALIMSLHSDKSGSKTNLFMPFSEAKRQGVAVREHERGVPFLFYNWNQYVNRNNPKDIISRNDYQALDAEQQKQYKGVHNREIRTLFCIDQTTMPFANEKEYKNCWQIMAQLRSEVREKEIIEPCMFASMTSY